jgi:hypothetical protein
MRFRIEQRVPAPARAVQDALVDPAYLERLAELPKLGRPELLDSQRDGATVRQRVRYRFAGELNAAARAALDPRRLTWIEDSTIDLDACRTTFRILPDHYADRLSCSGTFVVADEGDGCRRTAEGEMKVRMPLVGGKVEQAIVSGLREHAAAEATVLREWLQELR